MIHFGIDIHSTADYAAVRYDIKTGEMERQRFENSDSGRASLLAWCQSAAPCHIAFEACTGANSTYELLKSTGTITIVDGRQLRERFPKRGRKTDWIDAENLAKYSSYQGGGIWVPDMNTRVNRTVAGTRASFTDMSTQVKNIIHALLKEYQATVPKGGPRLWTQKGRTWLDNTAAARLPVRVALCVTLLLSVLDVLELALGRLEAVMAEECSTDPQMRRIATHPGLAHVAAFTIQAEIGNWSRFDRPKQIAAYSGLVPSVFNTGNKTVYGSITKTGRRLLRWILVECATTAQRASPDLGNMYRRIKKRTGITGKAKVAVGREILVTLWHMLVNNEDYRGLDEVKLKLKQKRIQTKAQVPIRRSRGVGAERSIPQPLCG